MQQKNTKKDNDSSNYEKFEAEESINEDTVNQKDLLENNLKSNKTQEIQSKNKNAKSVFLIGNLLNQLFLILAEDKNELPFPLNALCE